MIHPCTPRSMTMPRLDGTHIPADAWAALLPRTRSDGTDISTHPSAELFRDSKPKIPATTILRPSVPIGPRTAVVVGTFRGGTSFVAEALIGLGVPMGDRFVGQGDPRVPYNSFEDVDFND